MACFTELGETSSILDDFSVFGDYLYASIANDSGLYRFPLSPFVEPLAAEDTLFSNFPGPGGDNPVVSSCIDNNEEIFLVQDLKSSNTTAGEIGPKRIIWKIPDPHIPMVEGVTFSALTIFTGYTAFIAWDMFHERLYCMRTMISGPGTTDLIEVDRVTGSTTMVYGGYPGGIIASADGALWGRDTAGDISRYDPVLNDYTTTPMPVGATGLWSSFIPMPDGSMLVQFSSLPDPERAVRISPDLTYTHEPCMIGSERRSFRAAIAADGTNRVFYNTSGSGGGNPYPALYLYTPETEIPWLRQRKRDDIVRIPFTASRNNPRSLQASIRQGWGKANNYF